MGRNRIRSHVQGIPAVKGLRPFGRQRFNKPEVVLALDEYEAIRLLDYLHLNQEEAAAQMQVSRPTLTRIYERARSKYAAALVEGSVLTIGGGPIQLRTHLYHCDHCLAEISSEEEQLSSCPKCHSHALTSYDECHKKDCRQCRSCRKRGKHAQS